MRILFLLVFVSFFVSCSVSKKLERSARETVLSAGVLKTAHVGISVYEPATGKTWYDYQGDHYFVPASNTKIPTCYAAMKYLGDSLVGIKWVDYMEGGRKRISLLPTGDPTFLHPDFKVQPVFEFLRKDTSLLFMISMDDNWQANRLGPGWSWNDYAESYMAERSAFPIYGNVIHFYGTKEGTVYKPSSIELVCGDCGDEEVPFYPKSNRYSFSRLKDKNVFLFTSAFNTFNKIEIPFITSGELTIKLLNDTIKGLKFKGFKGLSLFYKRLPMWKKIQLIHSQPTDSLLRPMMHRSDNFFAEQTLLMVSNELLGFMNDERIIDSLLKTDFKDLPQKPRWADGSGLSRYNLFTPQDFVFILNKMKSEFGMARLKNILATGGEGTLSNYYVAEKDFLYAKTGSLSGVVALSGFLTTKKGKELIFSVQVNNHNGSATEVRRAVEKFVEGIRERY